MLAEAYLFNDQADAALTLICDALELVEATEERLCEAELMRLHGECLLRQAGLDEAGDAEACFQQALSVARDQQARWWELRTATSLAGFWRNQGKRQQAHDLLAPICDWFTEGLDTPDLKDAKTLLDDLA